MNKSGIIKYLFILTAIVIYTSCGKKEKDSFIVEGTLSNLESPYILFLTEHIDSISIDTIYTDRKGKFSYKNKVNHLTTASLYFPGKSYSVSVFVNKDWDIEIKGNADFPDLIEIEGGNINDDLTRFKKDNRELFQRRAELFSEIENPSNIEMAQNYETEIININFELIGKAKDYIEANPEKIASVILIQDFFVNNSSSETIDNLLDKLKGDAANYFLTDDLRKYSKKMKTSQIGVRAPSFKLTIGEREYSLNDFKDKYLLINFSSVTSGDSLGIDPLLINEFNNIKKDSLEILSVIISDEIKALPDSVKWKVYYDTKGWASDILQLYNITEIPYNILISPTGTIRDRQVSLISILDKDSLLTRTR